MAIRTLSISAFFHMRSLLAPRTLRILPRTGSTAWNVLSRASPAVPSAESPSTMKISRLLDGEVFQAVLELAGQR